MLQSSHGSEHRVRFQASKWSSILFPILTGGLLSPQGTGGQIEAPNAVAGGHYYAGVAVGTYKDRDTWPDIPNAVTGAEMLFSRFKDQFGFRAGVDEPIYNQKATLENSDATLNNILQQLDRLGKKVGENDQVVYYFIGHGTRRPRGNGANKEGVLVPWGASRDGEFLQLSVLLDRLSRLKAKEILVIIDSCHSGAAIRDSESEAAAQAEGNGKIRVVMASSGRDEESLDAAGVGDHEPLFTKVILDLLDPHENACDIFRTGYCTTFELGMLARLEVQDQSRERFGQVQSPMFDHFGGDVDGDFKLNLSGTEVEEWRSLRDSLRSQDPAKSLDNLADFIKKYPSGLIADAARAEQKKLLTAQMCSGTPPTAFDFKGLIGEVRAPGEQDLGKCSSGVPKLLNAKMGGVEKDSPPDDQVYVWAPMKTAKSPGFWIGQTEVSAHAFERVFRTAMPMSPAFNPRWKYTQQPIVNVSYNIAATFCDLVGGRLPTAEEWQFAAEGGNESDPQRPKSDSVNTADSEKPGHPVEVPVNSRFFPNRLQMSHVLGNVAEWIYTKPGEPTEIRGGSFADPYNRIDFTAPKIVDSRGGNTIGFRCVIDP